MTTEIPRFAKVPGGGKLGYSLLGPPDAPPILLNRPLGGSMALWGEFACRLSDELHVIAFDPRGVGASTDVPLGFGTRDMGRDAVALLDHLEVERAHVFGLSLGGMVASWVAADAPRRVRSLVIGSMITGTTAALRLAVRWSLPVLSALREEGGEAEARVIRAVLSPEFRRAHPERERSIEAKVRLFPAKRRNLLALAVAAARHSTAPLPLDCTADALLLFGDLDPAAQGKTDEELRKSVPHAIVEHVTDSGHDLSLEQPVATAEAILAFVHSLEVRRGATG
ncbi:MAG TPA: alpha/beta fold hydrolase [Polyangiaceae bacterium]|jgi:pimeloyl-ACP methyl ester carboxylesterase|nr:alpha/beta fold hydrolase [Polyangiaceae bacterium]